MILKFLIAYHLLCDLTYVRLHWIKYCIFSVCTHRKSIFPGVDTHTHTSPWSPRLPPAPTYSNISEQKKFKAKSSDTDTGTHTHRHTHTHTEMTLPLTQKQTPRHFIFGI